MPILLYRVDDRLIHGQVVIGWGQPLGVDLIVLVDDDVAASPWEQELYRMGVAPGVELRFASVADAVAHLAEWNAGATRAIVLTGNLEAMAALRTAAPVLVRQINVGGIHHRPGRRERLPYLYLTDDELRSLRDLEASGAIVTAQDLPSTAPVGVGALP
jgi:mannose/fructose/N-acetylgalactosamine-specific phosphotransferase system component IIB